jgi:hypothetical protein
MKIPYSSRIINSEHLFLKNLARSRVCSGEFAVVTSLVTDVTLCDFCRAGRVIHHVVRIAQLRYQDITCTRSWWDSRPGSSVVRVLSICLGEWGGPGFKSRFGHFSFLLVCHTRQLGPRQPWLLNHRKAYSLFISSN